MKLLSAGLLVSKETGRAFEAYSPDGLLIERWRGADALSGRPSWGVVKSLVEFKCPARLRPSSMEPPAAAPAGARMSASAAAAIKRAENKSATPSAVKKAAVPRHFFPLAALPPPALSSIVTPSGTQRMTHPVPPSYYAQIQWGMGLMNLNRCFFVTWMSADDYEAAGSEGTHTKHTKSEGGEIKAAVRSESSSFAAQCAALGGASKSIKTKATMSAAPTFAPRRAAESHWSSTAIAADVDIAEEEARRLGFPLAVAIHGGGGGSGGGSGGSSRGGSMVVRTPYGYVEVTVVR